MFQVQECIRQLQEKSSEPGGEWKFELRIRYLPLEWTEVYEADNLTFMSYYNQVCTAKTMLENHSKRSHCPCLVVPAWEFPTGNSLGNLGFEFSISHGKKITISLGKNRYF